MIPLLVQMNPTIGAIQQNLSYIQSIISKYDGQVEIIVFHELALTGYPPKDLLYRPHFRAETEKALKTLCQMNINTPVIIGHPLWENKACYNAASIIHQGQIVFQYKKRHLPNDSVFDEKRYFKAGDTQPSLYTFKDNTIALFICEDMWHIDTALPFDTLPSHLIILNASPFYQHKHQERLKHAKQFAEKNMHVLYVNQVGGEDELLFDGGSFYLKPGGELAFQAPFFEEGEWPIDTTLNHPSHFSNPSEVAIIYQGLTLGIRDYVHKNGFQNVFIGLSGGIDSALTLALAVDALGAPHVTGVLMPSEFTETISIEDAKQEAEALGIQTITIPIQSLFHQYLGALSPFFDNKPWDSTEENLQARIRGTLLMALANKQGGLVLSTSNKSETAVGYATLYGDMAGAFSPLKDCLKTLVYHLATYRNTLSNTIPKRVITRAPTAELRHNQKDSDSLPDYPVLDSILIDFLEHRCDEAELVQKGHDRQTVQRIISLIKRNEYKRQQSAVGAKITACAFGLDYRMPITSK